MVMGSSQRESQDGVWYYHPGHHSMYVCLMALCRPCAGPAQVPACVWVPRFSVIDHLLKEAQIDAMAGASVPSFTIHQRMTVSILQHTVRKPCLLWYV